VSNRQPDRSRHELVALLNERWLAYCRLPFDEQRALDNDRWVTMSELHDMLANPDNYGEPGDDRRVA
jgi:hypothetical protein